MIKEKKRTLTDKQKQVIALIACGYQDAEIAQEFNMSVNGVRAIVNKLVERFAVINRTHLVYECVKKGIIK